MFFAENCSPLGCGLVRAVSESLLARPRTRNCNQLLIAESELGRNAEALTVTGDYAVFYGNNKFDCRYGQLLCLTSDGLVER